jgi:hypothetical protein
MFAIVSYVIGATALGIAIASLAVLFRSPSARGEGSPYGTFAFWITACIVGPFAYAEGLTMYVGQDVQHAVERAYRDTSIRGPLQYYRVTKLGRDSAEAVVVGEEPESWGGVDRPVVTVRLKKSGDAWEPETFTIVRSNRLGTDSVFFPPYR